MTSWTLAPASRCPECGHTPTLHDRWGCASLGDAACKCKRHYAAGATGPDDYTPACPGCAWEEYIHYHDEGEDPPRADCCDHACGIGGNADYPSDDYRQPCCGHQMDDHDLRAMDGECFACNALGRRCPVQAPVSSEQGMVRYT